MPPSLGEELTERLSSSRFGRDVLGPKVARPLASWLETTFGDDKPNPDASTTAEATSDAPGATNPPNIATVPAAEGRVSTATRGAALDESGHDELIVNGSAPAAAAAAVVVGSAPRHQPLAQRLGTSLRDLSARVKNHNLVVVAAGIAFWGLLAIPATLFAVVSIAGLALNPATVEEQVNENLTGLPKEARTIIGDQLEGVSGGSTGGLITGLVVGLLLALWTSSGAMAKLMAALNTIYDTTETRNFLKLRGVALALTFGGIVFISSSIFLLAVLPALLRSIDTFGDSAATLFVWLRFPVLGLVMIIALGVLYHLGPDRHAKYRPLTLGACIAMVLWISLSGLFSVYTATVGSYNETYGSIGGIVVLLLWLFITAFVVLLGAEIHAQREQDRPQEDGPAKP